MDASITGERRNEDAFSIQILEARRPAAGFFKIDDRRTSRAASVRPLPDARSASRRHLSATFSSGLKDPSALDHLLRRLQRPAPQPADRRSIAANVARPQARWTFQTGTTTRGRGFEATPLLWDNVLYVTGSNNFAWALDARTGRPFWTYRRDLPPISPTARRRRSIAASACSTIGCSWSRSTRTCSRSIARPDAILWDIVLADYKIGYSATLAPLVIDGKVIVGISGGEYPTRGFLDAYDPATGKRIWRFSTIPESRRARQRDLARVGRRARARRRRTWMTGTYDPELNMLYWGTGNPNPDYYGADRKGDNLYTNSLVAIDAATGTLKWHYQFTPHDTHDWDANHVPVLADWPDRKVVMVANRNGFFYVLDRRTGELLLGKPFTDTTWAREIGKDGRPIVLNDGDKGCLPDMWGGTNFNPPSFDPALRMFFVNARESCATYRAAGAGDCAGPHVVRRRGADGSRQGLRRAARARRDDRRAQMGVQVHAADHGGRDVDGVGTGVRGRQRRQLHGVRFAERQEPVALLDRHAGLGRRADDLHARRQAARRHRLGHDAAVVRACRSHLTSVISRGLLERPRAAAGCSRSRSCLRGTRTRRCDSPDRR